MYNKWLLSICFLIININLSYGEDLPDYTAGNANDTNLSTFMFSPNNQFLQLTKKDGSSISYDDVNKLYGTPDGMNILVDGVDITSAAYRHNTGCEGIKPIGLDLADDSTWQNTKIPADKIAIDPNNGRFKFSSGNTELPKLSTTCDIAGTAYSLYVKDKYAYIINYPNSLKIIDIATTTPTVIATYQPGGFFYAVYGDGGYLYIAKGNTGLRIIDISNPTELKVISNLAIGGTSYNVYVNGDYAYLSTYEGGIYIVDIKDKTLPKVIGSYNTPGKARDVFVDGKYAYIADDTAGLQILDISNPATPTLISNYDTPGNAYSVYIYKNYVFIGDYSAGIQIIDISNPATPTLVSTYNTDGEVYDAYAIGDYAYIADGSKGVVVLNISNINSPQLFNKIALANATARELYIIGNYAYLAGSGAGMQIIDLPRSAQFPASTSTVKVRFNSKNLVKAALLTLTGNEVLEGGKVYPINWTITNLEELYTMSLYYSVDGGLTYPYPIVTDFVQLSIGTSTYNWNWKCPLINSDKVKVKIVIKDSLKNIIAEDTSGSNFTINTTQSAPQEDTWQVRLSVAAGEYADIVNGGPVFGLTPDAADDLDSYDKVEPPEPISGKYVTLYFPHPEAIFDRFDADIRSPFTGTKTWQAEIKTNISNTYLNISWQELPQGYKFILHDITQAQKIDMTSNGTYTYYSQTGGIRPLEFMVTCSGGSSKVPVGTVAGIVTDAITGEKIQGTKIVLSSIDQEIIIITDKAGYYISPPVKAGTYTIKVNASGYQLLIKSEIIVASGIGNTQNLTLTALVDNFSIDKGTTTAIPGTITKEGKGSTTISSNFFSQAALPIDKFLVTIKLRHSTTQEEIKLLEGKRTGESGLIITQLEGNKYVVSYNWDPEITVKAGRYDIYFQVTDGTDIIIDKYEDNPGELSIVGEIYERVLLVEPPLNNIYFNEEVNVDIRIEAITDLYGFQFNLKFNPDLLQLVEAKEGNFLNSDGVATYWIPPQVIDNGLSVVCTRLGDKGVTGSGILARVKFKSRQLVGTVTLIPEDVKLSDSQANKIPITQAIESKVIILGKPVFTISHNAIRPLKANDVLEVTILGDSNGTATFDVGNIRTSLPMKEVSPGVYKGSYTIAAGDNLLKGTITGYLTIKGVSNSQSAPTLVTIDTIPPTTTLTVGTPSLQSYIKSITPMTLTAFDTVSGIADIIYKINNTVWMTYTTSFKITTQGSSTIYYRSLDLAGNSDEIRMLNIFVDDMPPVTTDNAPLSWQKNTVTVTLTPIDTGCGLKNTYYTTDGATPTLNSATGTMITFYKHGTYTLKYLSIDWLGNIEESKTAVIKIDKEAPMINMTQPVNKSIVTDPNILIKATVTDTSIQIGTITLRVNELERAILIANNIFSFTGTLTSGLNTIKLIAEDLAGNMGSATLLMALVTSKIDVLANKPVTLTTSKGTKVNIPVNAFNKDITLTLNDAPKQTLYKPADELLAATISAFEIPPELVNEVYEITPFYMNDCSQILQPLLPMTITLTYNASIPDDIESNLKVCRLNPDTNQWILIDEEIKIDKQVNTITFSSINPGIYRLVVMGYRITVLDKDLHLGIINLNQSATSSVGSFRIKNTSPGNKKLTNIRYIIPDLQNINKQIIPSAMVKIVPEILTLIPANQEKKVMVKIDAGKTVTEGIYSGNILIYADLNNNSQFNNSSECSDSVNLNLVVSTKVVVNLSILPQKKTVDLNEQASVDIYFQAPHAIDSFSFILQFDPTLIEVLSVEKGSLFSLGDSIWSNPIINNQDGTVKISGKKPDDGVKVDGTLATIKFKPKTYGRCNLGFKDIEFIKPYNEKVQVTGITGYIVVNPWDIELDGIIDIYDLVKVGRYFNSKIGDTRYIPASDLNDNGEIDIYDLVMVASHLLKVYNFTKTSKLSSPKQITLAQLMMASEYQKVDKDKLFEVDIDVKEITDLFGFQFDVIYNKDIVEIVNIEYGSSLLNTGEGTIYIPESSHSAGAMNIAVCRVVPDGINGSGKLVKIIFKANTANIDTIISINNVKLANSKAEKIPVNVLIDKLQINIQPQLQILPIDFSTTYVWPNPAKEDNVHFANLPANTYIRIFNLAGEEVFNYKVSVGDEYIWAGKNIASGVYIYLLTDAQGNKKAGKLAVIK